MGSNDFHVGDDITFPSRLVTQEHIAMYAEASGDANPIHLDEEFAKSVGLSGTIAHGMLTMGIVAEAIAEWVGSAGRLSALSCRFSRPLYPGDALTVQGRVSSTDGEALTLEFEATSDRRDRVLTGGRATVRVKR